ELGEALPRERARPRAERAVEVAAPLEAAAGLVPARLQEQRLAEQAPRERLGPHRARLLGELERAPRVVLDARGAAVAVEVQLADAVVDAEHARDGRRRGGVGPEPLDLRADALAPVAAEVRDDRERLARRGDVVRVAGALRQVPRLLGVGPGAVDLAALPGL